jgi:hypothetical protein
MRIHLGWLVAIGGILAMLFASWWQDQGQGSFGQVLIELGAGWLLFGLVMGALAVLCLALGWLARRLFPARFDVDDASQLVVLGSFVLAFGVYLLNKWG